MKHFITFTKLDDEQLKAVLHLKKLGFIDFMETAPGVKITPLGLDVCRVLETLKPAGYDNEDR